MVQRIVKTANTEGRFARPAKEELLKAKGAPADPGQTKDMVEAILANETN